MDIEDSKVQVLLQQIPKSIFVKFITNLTEYDAGDLKLDIQTHFDENTLNDLLHGILLEVLNPNLQKVHFDFLVQGKLLRGKINSHILRYQISCEDALKVEYFLAFQTLEKSENYPEQDWISSMTTIIGDQQNIGVVAGLFNGALTFEDFNSTNKKRIQRKTQNDPVKAIKSLPSEIQNVYYLISGGLDEEVCISTFERGKQIDRISSSEHEGTILAIDINPNLNNHFCTVGNGGNISIWKIPEDFLSDSRKAQNKKKKKHVNQKQLKLVSGIKLHDDSINSVCWIDNNTIVTGSSDHSLKLVDVEKLEGIQTIKTKDSITTSIDYSHNSLLTSHEDGFIRMWDFRNSNSPILTFKSHAKLASCLKFHKNPHIFASGAYDQTIKIWDSRSVFPLQTLSTQYNKIFCLEWMSNSSLVSGGSSPSINFHSF